MLELGGGIQRIRVDDRHSGAQRAEHDHRVLQDVRQHDRNAIALLQAVALQPGGEAIGETVQVLVTEALFHLDKGSMGSVLLATAVYQSLQRRVFARVDFGGCTGRILLDPESVHTPRLPPTRRPALQFGCTRSKGLSTGQTLSSRIGCPRSLGCSPSPCISAGRPAMPSSRKGTSGTRWACASTV